MQDSPFWEALSAAVRMTFFEDSGAGLGVQGLRIRT